MTARRLPPELSARSSEILLWCDAQQTVIAWDPRAARRLALRAPRPFAELAVPGTEARAREFLDLALSRGGDLDHPGPETELALLVDGEPGTVRFAAQRTEDGLALLGLVVPQHFERAVGEVGRALHQVVDLNREIARQRDELSRSYDDLDRSHRELAESNQGIRSLHDELNAKALEVERQAEIKARVVANVSHEFRTPLHSILGLTQLLLDEADGPLLPEQAVQVRYIRSSCEELLTLVNDVLDLTKVEAGKAALHTERFSLDDLLVSLRGVLRPLRPPGRDVDLIVEGAPADVLLETDRTKVAQILRNLVSNAFKFTERGEIRVRATRDGDDVAIHVSDTGIGIRPEDHDRVFEEFGQVDGPLQRKHPGTGLGLSLSRRLATLLGGTLTLESQPGRGSTFTLTIPSVHPEVQQMADLEQRSRRVEPGANSILVVEDDRKTIFVYDRFLTLAGFHVVPARSLGQARAFLERTRPAAIVLDVMLENEASWDFLASVKRDPATADIPVLVVTVTNRAQKARALGADEFWLKPIDQDRLLRKLRSLPHLHPPSVLMIDDDPQARYLVRRHLAGSIYSLLEAGTGEEGVAIASREHPSVILLDFLLEGATAFDVIDELKASPDTRAIPIIIVTSHVLDESARERLLVEADAVISKEHLSRELALNRIRDALGKATLHRRRNG